MEVHRHEWSYALHWWSSRISKELLLDGDSNVDPGQTYSVLIAAGNNRHWRLSKKGAGLVELPWSGKLDWGKLEIGHKNGQKYRFTVTHSAGKVSAAVWWPDGAESHSHIDLVLYDPSGEEAARSQAVDSVFEKLEAPARQGEWTIEVFGFDVPKNRQDVYLSVIRRSRFGEERKAQTDVRNFFTRSIEEFSRS